MSALPPVPTRPKALCPKAAFAGEEARAWGSATKQSQCVGAPLPRNIEMCVWKNHFGSCFRGLRGKFARGKNESE